MSDERGNSERDRAGAGEGPDAGANDRARDEGEPSSNATKTQDLTKAGRDHLDPDAGTE